MGEWVVSVQGEVTEEVRGAILAAPGMELGGLGAVSAGGPTDHDHGGFRVGVEADDERQARDRVGSVLRSALGEGGFSIGTIEPR
jgi:hypothetical protein